MKRLSKKGKGVVKGAPSGFMLSIMIHAAAFLLAGMLVVFTVTKKEEKKFTPPKPVDRPKIKLKKPKVKVKKSAKPKSTTRIVTKVKSASMPDIQLPEMSGMSDGLAGGIGGFDIMPDLSEVTLFGGGQTIGNDFVGTFYDVTKDYSGRTITMDPEMFANVMLKFLKSGWRPSTLARYYRSPQKLYATTFAVPPVQSVLAPEAFGEPDASAYCWAAHYKGQLVYPEDITFRFWGLGDDMMMIRVDNEVVLIANYPNAAGDYFPTIWQTSSSDSHKYPMGNNYSIVGDWITLKAGEPLDMEVVFCEVYGGVFQAMLCVEVQGETYPKNPFLNGPTLPIFKTEEPSIDLVEAIHADLDPGDASVTNGPVFRDYTPKGTERVVVQEEGIEPVVEEENPMRIWTLTSGKTVQAQLVTQFAREAVLKNQRGKQVKVPLEQLSEEDRRYIALSRPPKFSIEFSKKNTQLPVPPDAPFNDWPARPYRAFDFVFGTKVKQRGANPYPHELTVEYYAIGAEVDGKNFTLLDRQSQSFVPAPENKQTITFHGEKVFVKESAIRTEAPMRGTRYGGFLITITDEQGKVIQHKTSHEWLFANRENLDEIPVGKHFDKLCERVGPPRPGKSDRPSSVFF